MITPSPLAFWQCQRERPRGVRARADDWIDLACKVAWRDAELITGLGRDRFTLIGSGTSMRPVYGEDTVLVVVKTDFA